MSQVRSDEWALVPIEATALLTTDRLGLQPAVLDFLDNEEQPRALNRVWAGICTVGASSLEELTFNIVDVTIDRSAKSVSFVSLLLQEHELPATLTFEQFRTLRGA